MVIVRVLGGLGNQLFQYALYRSLQESGRAVYLDMSAFRREEYRNIRSIAVFPKAVIQEADPQICSELADTSRNFCSKIRRKIFGRKSTYVAEDHNLHFQEEILSKDNVYLSGCWQSELYFRQIREKLLEELVFPPDIGNQNEKILKMINNNNSVSVHIRRGDYLEGRASKVYGGICTDQYYDNAVSYMRNKHRNTHFFIFSNDVEWVKEHYSSNDMTVVDWNTGENDYLDMYLMTQCRHNIIANSSFSWWGAWLNQHTDKEVISPIRWFNPEYHEAPHIICDDWIRMEG